MPPLVDALLAQGRYEEGMQLADVAAQKAVPVDIDAQVGWRRVQAKLLARRGELREAERLARDALARVERTDYLDLRAQVSADLAEVLHLAHRPAESAAAPREASQLFEQKGNTAAVAQLRDRLAVVQTKA